jgi:peptidoglycan/LPS O-acetylase OafA/YrhL
VDEVVATKGFSFSNFYVRRARRILPALFFTIGLSAIFAFLLFSPEHFERFGASMLHAAASLANVLFWRESG